VEKNPREIARPKLKRLLDIENAFSQLNMYTALSASMREDISRLMKLYGV